MAAPAYRTVVWEPPLSPGVVPDVLAWPDMFLGAQISCSLDMSALPIAINSAIATAWPQDLELGEVSTAGSVLTLEIGGGSVNAYVITFTLFLATGDVLPVQTQIEVLAGDGSFISMLSTTPVPIDYPTMWTSLGKVLTAPLWEALPDFSLFLPVNTWSKQDGIVCLAQGSNIVVTVPTGLLGLQVWDNGGWTCILPDNPDLPVNNNGLPTGARWNNGGLLCVAP